MSFDPTQVKIIGGPGASPDFDPSQAKIQSRPQGGFDSSQVHIVSAPQQHQPQGLPPHGALPYDDVIIREAKAAGVPADFAIQIGRIESGGERDRANATSGAGARGVFQLMPDTARGLGVRNITDPLDNIRGGVRYLSQLLKRYHGDTVAAAAAYNMGPGAYDEYRAGKIPMPQETANYIDQLHPIPADAPETHKLLGAAALHHVRHVADTFIRAQKMGKNPFQAIARTPEVRPLSNLEHEAQERLQWVRDHPLEALGDIVGAPQRALGELHAAGHAVQSGQRGKYSPQELFHAVWDAAINPTDAVNARTTRGVADTIQDTTGIRIPTHAEIDRAIHAHVWKALQPAASTVAKAGEDLALQTVSDPLSLPGGLLERGLNAAGGVARAAHGLMPVQAAANWAHLPQLASAMEDLGSRAFGVRRDLDAAGFTREGKQARIAMENAELTKQAHNEEANRRVLHDPQASAKRYVHYIAEHGKGRTAADARLHPLNTFKGNAPATGHAGPHPDFHANVAELADPLTSPERRLEILNNTSHSIFNNQLAARSEQFFGRRPNLFRGNALQLRGIGTEEALGIQKFLDNSPTKLLREIGKKAIIWNPLPHGIKNVGTLTYLAGGLPAVARGLAAITHPPSPAEVRELEEMGALPKYLGEMSGNKVADASQAAIERMELGWRYGLAKTLEKKLGVPKTEEEKLLRGWLINNKVGDYRNQSAFVKFFQALGGPFVAFRLGIVPKRVAEAFVQNPERIAAATRANQDVNQNRQGGNRNELTIGGPVEDEAKLLSDPLKYLANTIGTLGSLGKEPQAGSTGILQSAANLAGSYIPGVSALQDAGKILEGTERPGQQTTNLSDKLMDVLLYTLGVYYAKKETPKQEATKRREIMKGSI